MWLPAWRKLNMLNSLYLEQLPNSIQTGAFVFQISLLRQFHTSLYLCQRRNISIRFHQWNNITQTIRERRLNTTDLTNII